jgi:ABC-type dipeptide/oligopeptide/nickel transport system ATPase component
MVLFGVVGELGSGKTLTIVFIKRNSKGFF